MKAKHMVLALVAMFSLGNLSAQEKRASPPATMEVKVGEATVTINYSQPSVKGRKIYGDLVPYGKVWRTGANEATTFSTDKDLMVNGKKLPAGTYALFTIPGEKEWTVIFNKVAKQWGAYKYDEKEDVLRITAKPVKTEMTEKMTFKAGKNGMLYLDWAETRIPIAIKA